ncbi:MAG: hypothetical protein INH41_01150 [Myxococcaceae bacterium]|jgi:hypothetical protein|nr:hypothetical protein [Myxococcaceae bacterium]MCA3010985.1 hypothetical protein [Myxococcaceae bacterium]
MEGLGKTLVVRRASVASVLALGVVALAGLGLAGFLLVSVDWAQGVSHDVRMGLGFSLTFGLPAAAGCFVSVRRRFAIRERGISVRRLFSSFEFPFTALAAIAVRRTTTNQRDLFSGKVDVGYLVTVMDDRGRAAVFDHRGYGLDEVVEPLLERMIGGVTEQLERRHARGEAIAWAPGVVIGPAAVQLTAKRRELSLDDAEVRLLMGNGVVELLRRDEHLATLPVDGVNFEPGRRLLAAVSAWRVGS